MKYSLVMKTCPHCAVLKEPAEFGKAPKRKDGLRSWCLACERDAAKTPEAKARSKAWHSLNAERVSARKKTWWQENKESQETPRRLWAEQHQEQMRQWQKARRQEHQALLDSLKTGKSCLDCHEHHPTYVMEFDHVRGEKVRGISRMSNHKQEQVLDEIAKCELVCCACHRIRSHARRKPPNTKKLIEFQKWMWGLKDNPCTDCGRVRPPVAMDFDHVRGEKVQSISKMWGWKKDKVLVELQKCELVCANCHRERTIQRGQQRPVATRGSDSSPSCV